MTTVRRVVGRGLATPSVALRSRVTGPRLEVTEPATPRQKEPVMGDKHAVDTRRYKMEQIKAKELARGASEDEANRIAAATVDKVIASEGEDK